MIAPTEAVSDAPDPASLQQQPAEQTVTVAVVAIAGQRHLSRCLSALKTQTGAPPFNVVVAASDRLEPLDGVRREFPDVRIISRVGVRTPIDLAAVAVNSAKADLILLTEDHCVPDPDWVSVLSRSIQTGRGAVGGAIEPMGEMSDFEWAFYFVDFFRYQGRLREGQVDSLSVCNVAYRRHDLNSIDEDSRAFFHETRIHAALKKSVGRLWMVPAARVRTRRRVDRSEALRERYAFGRIYACRLAAPGERVRRWWLVFAAPVLPMLLLMRVADAASTSRPLLRRFFSALPDVSALVAAWSWGEALGYLTGRLPESAEAARDHGEEPL